jgi:hypothetical protein
MVTTSGKAVALLMWTSSQGLSLLFAGSGIFPYFFTAVSFHFWQVAQVHTRDSTAALTPGH